MQSRFLNVDLMLQHSEDLSSLADYFRSSAFVMFCGEAKGSNWLYVESVIDGHMSDDPNARTEDLLSLVEALPKELRDVWNRGTTRIFDYGFEGGLEGGPIGCDLSKSLLERLLAAGAELRITVYPYAPMPASNE